MKDDLLILKLLKIPVTIIKYLSKFIAMLTYLPNYVIILVLDTVIFSNVLTRTWLSYVISWPLRLAALVAVFGLFVGEFYGMYLLLSIQHLHWGVQLGLAFVAFQGLLALMRHGYLTMIKKFSPTKLKSPLQHLHQLSFILIDLISLLPTILNIFLLINLPQILNYTYSPNAQYNYLTHITKLTHKSILDLIKLFYIKIFFRVFPWRYLHAKADVDREEGNILQLVVLLSLLFWGTVGDLGVVGVFGGLCWLHPRGKLYRTQLASTHTKSTTTLKFLLNILLQLLQITILLFCLPLKYKYSKQLLSLICAKENDYSHHYMEETLFVLKLALVKVPALVCQLVLLVFFYKFGKIGYLEGVKKGKYEMEADGKVKEVKLFQSKFKQAAPIQQQTNKSKQKHTSYYRQIRLQQREYIVFRCFGSLMSEIPFLLLVPFCTLVKPWNMLWVRFLVDQKHDLRVWLVLEYFGKIIRDIANLLLALFTTILVTFYDPIKSTTFLKSILKTRQNYLKLLPSPSPSSIPKQSLIFYFANSAILPMLVDLNFTQLKQDILFLPLFVASRVSLLSLMGCQHPQDSVELFQYIWMLFYMKRVKSSPYFQEYLGYLKTDQAAGMIKNSRERLRFWKFAHKSVRHRYISRFLSMLLPKRRAQKAKANAKIQKNFSLISNHYWHCYNTTISLLQYLLAFIIQIIITLFGVVVLLPLTLWRMPTFLILFKMHSFKKKLFFTILFAMYKQMAKDIPQLFFKVITFVLFPRAFVTFVVRNSWRYSEKGVEDFDRVEIAKIWYIVNKILFHGLFMYGLLWKIAFVKILWIRKRDMNQHLQSQNIKLSKYVLNFLLTPQQIPTLPQVLTIYTQSKQKGSSSYQSNKQDQKQNKKLQDISAQGDQIDKIVTPYVIQTCQDLPYLLLMVFLVFTLPWRFFYIKNALFMMRDDKIYRREFIRILKLIAKDYQCIFLYLLMILSVVKAKRAVQLFVRNFKLNFYVGTLKYSHLKQLQNQLKQAVYFYKSVLILIASCMFGPYRIPQTYQILKAYYKKVTEQREQREKNRKIYENTIKEGKSLDILTNIGNNSLLQVFTFLNARELTVMTRVSKYMYDTIKERDQVWVQQWERLYQNKYPDFIVKNETGNPSYNSMCIQKFIQQNPQTTMDHKDQFYQLALRQFSLSTFETTLDLKRELEKVLPRAVFQRMFTTLRWSQNDGYGPEQNWPQPGDNEEFLALFNIERRATVVLEEQQAAASLLFERPVEFFIIRLNRFYNTDTHRKKKQICYAAFNVFFPIFLLIVVIFSWSWIWQINSMIGCKILLGIYWITFFYLFFIRYTNESRRWIALNPFDIVDDIVNYSNVFKNWVTQKSTIAADFAKDKLQRYVQRPIRWIARKISHYARLIGRKVKYVSQLFVEKVAKPLYIKISHQIIAVIQLIKDIYFAFVRTLVRIVKFFGKVFKNIYNILFQIVKSVSKFYASLLEQSLKLALSFGTVGQLIFTIIVIVAMISPSLICYHFFYERWFIILSTLLSMVLMVTGYKHLNRIKQRVLARKKQ